MSQPQMSSDTSSRARSIGKGVVLSLVCLCLLGVMPIVSNLRDAGIGALPFAFALSVWQVILVLPLVFWEVRRGQRGMFDLKVSPSRRRRLIGVALLGGVLFGLSTWFYVLGVEQAGATNAAIAIQAYPVFAIVWESLFLHRHKTRWELLLTGVLLITLYLLGTGGTGQLSGLSPWFLVALGVPFLWSIAHVMIKEELNVTPITPIQETAVRVTVSAVFLLGVLALTQPAALPHLWSGAVFRTMSVIMGVLYLAELLVWFTAVRHIDISLGSSVTTPWPALTMVLAALFLGETVAPYQVVALIVVVATIYGLTFLGMCKGTSVRC